MNYFDAVIKIQSIFSSWKIWVFWLIITYFFSKCPGCFNMSQKASKCIQNELCKCFVHEIIKEVVFISYKRAKINEIHLTLCDGKPCITDVLTHVDMIIMILRKNIYLFTASGHSSKMFWNFLTRKAISKSLQL